MKLRHGAANLMANMNADDAQDESDDVEYDPRQLDIDRNRNDQRLKSRFEHIFSKYEHDFEGVADEIDISTGKIVVNNGHIQHMEHEADPGKSASSLFAQAFQDELEHEEEEEDDEEDEEEDDDVEKGADDDTHGAGDLDEALHSSGIEDIPTVTSRPPNMAARLGISEKPIPKLARLIANEDTPQRTGTQAEGEQAPEAPSSAITVSGLATPLLGRFPGFYQSVRDAQPDTGRRSVAPEAVKALGVSIATQLAQYMPGSARRKKKAKEPRLSLPAGVTDPTWAYPELPASVTQKRQRSSSPIGEKAGSSPVPITVGQESLWTAEGVVRPRKRRRTQAEMADGTPTSAIPLVMRPSSSGKGKQTPDLRRCWNCSLTRTPSWQQGPHGQDLCVSCGRYFERYRRMKPFDSTTPEPEERAPKQVEASTTDIHHEETGPTPGDRETDEALHVVHAPVGGVETRSSPPVVRYENENQTPLQQQAQAPETFADNGAAATCPREDEPERVAAIAKATTPDINAATHKPIAFVMLPKQPTKVTFEGASLSPEETSTGIMEAEVNAEMHTQQDDRMDDYVIGFETTPAGQLERQLNPLLHHNPVSIQDEATPTVGTITPAAMTPVLEPGSPTTPSSSDHGVVEQHDDATTHNVRKNAPWKHSAWNNSHDELLLELREERDLEWEDISGFLPGHSPEAVERRYELLIDAAAHTMRVCSQTLAPEAAPLPQSISSATNESPAERVTRRSPSKQQPLQAAKMSDVSSPNGQPAGVATTRPEDHLDVVSVPAVTSPTAASIQPVSSPAEDYSPLPDYRDESEDPVGVTSHGTPPSNTTVDRTAPEATPSTGGRHADFALIDDVFDNLELTDPSQQLFREMGSSPSPAAGFGHSDRAVGTPTPADGDSKDLELAAPEIQAAASNTPRQPATRSPYRTRKRPSDQSARDSVVEAEDLSLCPHVSDPSSSDPSNGDQRPRLSYAQLVEAAFLAHDRRPLQPVDVFTWVESKYPWFRKLKDSPLRAGIRATLSAMPQFVRIELPDGTKAWRFLKALGPINAKIRARRKSRRITIGTDFADNDPMDVSQLIEEEDELATPKTTSMRKSLLRKFVSPRMSTPVPIFVQSTKKMDKRRSSGRVFLDLDTGTPMREVDPDEDELAAV
ncbi:hypothetical protein CLAFUW4_08418 [Fulvia fulva]|nr:hypothetical protein CLAFUR4_08423 [Fulvia fulva]KAK4630608.1 hypothetical protein CLAFUR0_08418 [Fulvia fulva]WPV13067.1 hypothetical protein CLAFUW4_08418 [Fulvia fulva]WPV27744.1 hypothetical protein CLAFUW7_08418 [Fulvia fulva]